MNVVDRIEASEVVRSTTGKLGYMTGFENSFATEALPNALPMGRNSPQKAPFGLYAEQLSGSASPHRGRRTNGPGFIASARRSNTGAASRRSIVAWSALRLAEMKAICHSVRCAGVRSTSRLSAATS